jgi:cupin fold WbuC family metalloprotein
LRSGTEATIGRLARSSKSRERKRRLKLDFTGRSLRKISAEETSLAGERARSAPRRRALLRYHEHEETVQRMINAVEPDSYVRPHRHADPDKVEVFLALRGSAVVCAFDETGRLIEHVPIRAGGPCFGVEIPPRVWHSLLALEQGTVLYEMVEGPFQPETHKDHAPWAPPEGTPEGCAYHRELRSQLALGPDTLDPGSHGE